MFKPVSIILYTCLAVLLIAGCTKPQPANDIPYEGLKIRDLKPYHSNPNNKQTLIAASFEILTFEVPLKQIDTLNSITTMLYTVPLQFTDEKSFRTNAFLAGFGESTMWDKVANLLSTAQATQGKDISLLITQGHHETILAERLYQPRTIIYASPKNPSQAITISPGQLTLNLDARKIPSQRGVTLLKVSPVFSKGVTSIIPEIAEKIQESEITFTAAGFNVKMSPDDFIFIWPGKGVAQKNSLANIFFTSPEKQTFKTYLIICTGLNY